MTNPTNTWKEGPFLVESFPKLLTISKEGRYIRFEGREIIRMFTWFTDDFTNLQLLHEYFFNHSISEGDNDA
jgi:hypothetical protein